MCKKTKTIQFLIPRAFQTLCTLNETEGLKTVTIFGKNFCSFYNLFSHAEVIFVVKIIGGDE
jgi:hypothetical protein